MDKRLEERYFNWLCAKIIRPELPHQTYYELFRVLHGTEFVWLVIGDDNRAADGVELRYRFLVESGADPEHAWSNVLCSIFEMLIAFSYDAEFQTEVSYRDWFWELIDNLGLTPFDDDHMDYESVSDILYRFVWRLYDADGVGGLFPLKHPEKDQRKVELWYQFFPYLEENEDRFPID